MSGPGPSDFTGRLSTAEAGLDLPEVFGRYLLVRRLARGGMGEVFLGKSGQLSGFEKLCVIKRILPQLSADNEFVRRFIDEAQVAVMLSHPNIATVFEVGKVEGAYFLALEYVEGRDLRRVLSRLWRSQQKLPPDVALFLVRELAEGLAYAHRRANEDGKPLHLVHCDVSPPNVIISFEGVVKIIDFGISKSAMRTSFTNPRRGFGKHGYMAPEQCIKGGAVDRRTDVYACGVLLFELLTGQRLFHFVDGTDYREVARQVVQGKHAMPSDHDLSLARFDALVARTLEVKPSERFQTAEELRDAIQLELAELNPALTADRVGAFFRDLFADELERDRQLLRDANAARLDDYEEELADSGKHTVSITMRHTLPFAPLEPAAAELRARADRDAEVEAESQEITAERPWFRKVLDVVRGKKE